MRRLAWLLPLITSAALAQSTPSVRLRDGVLHIASAASLPGSCAIGVSPSFIADDTGFYYPCDSGSSTYVLVPIPFPNYGLSDITVTDPELQFTPLTSSGGGGQRWFACASGCSSAQFAFTQATSGLVTAAASGGSTSGRWLFTGTGSPAVEVTGYLKAGTFNNMAITNNGSNTLNIAASQTLTVSGSATLTNGTHSGTNTGDETAARVRTLGFFDTTNDGTTSGLDADLLDGNSSGYFQVGDADLTAIATQGTTAHGISLLDDADAAASRATIGALYSLPIAAVATGIGPLDATTYYFGPLQKAINASATAGLNKTYIRKAGVIRSIDIYTYAGTVAGSNESWTIGISVNGAAATTIATVATAGPERNFTNTGLSIAVSSGDYFELTTTTPTWATNPSGIFFSGHVDVE